MKSPNVISTFSDESTIERKEIDLFGSIPISKWMDTRGIMKGLHDMNAVRVPFITDMYRRLIRRAIL